MPDAVDDEPREDASALPPSSPRRRSRRRVVVAGLGLVIVVIAVWTVVTGLIAEHRLRMVRADVSRLTTQTGLDRTSLEHDLGRDLRTVDSARAMLHQPGPRVVSWLPLVGRNVGSEQVVADASAAALKAGLTLTRSTADLTNGNGDVNIARLVDASQQLSAAADALRPSLRRLAAQPTGWTLPQVQVGTRQARNQLLDLADRLARCAAGLRAVAGVLGQSGRRTILVGLMNNAELRGAGGLLSAYALGHTDNGHLSLGPFRDVNLVAEPPRRAVPVPAPASYRDAYGAYLANSTLWKNVTMSAQGPDSAQVLAEVAAASLHVRPDVVALMDVPAAADIISASGPVTIEGESVSGEELTKRLLVDAYGNGSLSPAKEDARRRALTSAASQAFGRLRHDATSTPAVLQALLDAVSGRHIVMWSARPDEQRLLAQADVAGAVDATGKDIALAVTNNLGDRPSQGNKLDYYVRRRLSVAVTLRPNEALVTQTLTLHNTAPAGLGPYVEGVRHPGEVDELLSLDAAQGATLTSFTHDGLAEDVRLDQADGAQRVTTLLTLPRGETTTFRLQYRLALHDGEYRLLLVPQALARPAELALHVRAVGAQLGVVSGINQPRDGRIDLTGSWDSLHDITVPVHGYEGLRGLFHDIAHFWTHKVTL
jgi:hypothetical protein